MLFTFPSRYWFAIGLLRVFSLGGWSRRIHTGFLVSRATQGTATLRMASCTGRSPAMARCSNLFHSPCFLRSRGPTTPCVPEHAWFGLFPVRSPLLGESLLFSLPAGTKMFQFPAFAAHTYVRADSHSDCRVVPFGDPRIKGYLHLIADYRSLSRPSSPVRAKASTVRPKNSLFAFIMIHHTFI